MFCTYRLGGGVLLRQFWSSSDFSNIFFFPHLSPQLIKHFEIKPDPTMGELKSITRTLLVPDKPVSLHFVERQVWELDLLCMFCEHINDLMKMIWPFMRILFIILRILGVAGVRQKRQLWKFATRIEHGKRIKLIYAKLSWEENQK